jgi:hypothetical protein
MDGPIYNYNQSALDIYNYTVYPNGTVSNGSECYLSFGEYQPTLFDNGTFFNTTACDTPYYSVHSRGIIGVVFAVVMLMLIPASLFNLHKHGARYMEEKKRFKNISRRWPWYWLLILQALCGVAGFFSIDLDRDYLQGTSLTIYGALFTATLPVALAACWELTRHWGSFEERKLDDADPFRFRQNDFRSKVHLLMPIGFYLLALITFFLTVLRNWDDLVNYIALFTVSVRWKIGVIFSYLAWLQIIFQIVVTRIYYKVPSVPLVIPTCLVCLLAEIIYGTVAAWDVGMNAFNTHSSVAFVALMAYLPLVLITVLMNLSGLARENEDLLILARRRIRERRASRGIVKTMREKGIGENLPETIPLSTAPSFISNSDTLVSEEENRKIFSFKRFFGAAPIKGHSWLTHNLKYLPCSGRKSEFNVGQIQAQQRSLSDAVVTGNYHDNPDYISHQEELEELNAAQIRKSSVSGRVQAQLVKNSGMTRFLVQDKVIIPERPPPADLREKWKKREEAKLRRESYATESIASTSTKVAMTPPNNSSGEITPIVEDDVTPLFEPHENTTGERTDDN